MTKEEAIELLDNLLGMVEDNQNHDYDEALKMAIEAFKQPEIIGCGECKYSYDEPPTTDGRYWCVLHGWMRYCSEASRSGLNDDTNEVESSVT